MILVLRWRIQKRAHAGKHVAEHLRRQHAGIGVVARAMIAVEEAKTGGRERMPRAMREGKLPRA